MEVARRLIIVRTGNGHRDRNTIMPERLEDPVKAQMSFAHEHDRDDIRQLRATARRSGRKKRGHENMCPLLYLIGARQDLNPRPPGSQLSRF
jgi:hypothetical protein